MGKVSGRVSGSRASTEPCSTVSALPGFDPARSIFNRWRLYADRLYRNPEARRQFEHEYQDWYLAKFGVAPEETGADSLVLLPVWAAYRMAVEDIAPDCAMNLRRLNAMLLNLKGRISNLPRRNVGGFLDTQIREVLADIASIEDRVAIAMEAREGGDGGTRPHPKDDSAARRDRPTPVQKGPQ